MGSSGPRIPHAFKSSGTYSHIEVLYYTYIEMILLGGLLLAVCKTLAASQRNTSMEGARMRHEARRLGRIGDWQCGHPECFCEANPAGARFCTAENCRRPREVWGLPAGFDGNGVDWGGRLLLCCG